MSPHHGAPSIACDEDREVAMDRTSERDFAMLEEFSFVRREAQAEANLAYEDWGRLGSADAYAVYRAAQDRADAAQDDLTIVAERLAA